jgi:hypothetical protein
VSHSSGYGCNGWWKSKACNIVGRCRVVLQASWPSKISERRKLIILIFIFKKSYALYNLLTST